MNNEHATLVSDLKKRPEQIMEELTPIQADALHMAVGVSGEAGELLDAIKKFAVYQKPLDRTNVIEELGDIEFYLEGLRQALGISRNMTIIGNIEKLQQRYSKGIYSNNQAQKRADKELNQGGKWGKGVFGSYDQTR